MRRTSLLMLLLGVLMAFTIAFLPSAANAITKLSVNDAPILAIPPAPTMDTAMPLVPNWDTSDQATLFARGAPLVLTANTAETTTSDHIAATLNPAANDIVAWGSTIRNDSVLTATNPADNATITDSAATARGAPNIETAATLTAGFPNDFNAQALALTCETTLATTATSANSGRFNEMPGLVGAVVADYTTSGGQHLQAA